MTREYILCNLFFYEQQAKITIRVLLYIKKKIGVFKKMQKAFYFFAFCVSNIT